MTSDLSHDTYSDPRVVAVYDGRRELTEGETALFEEYVARGSAVLDIGVGTGHTTPFLAGRASRYVGVDYSEAMVARSRERFPGLDFRVLDARSLTGIGDGAFDVAVFSFNGIDSIQTVAGRRACLREVARVLRAGGMFLLSTHNPRHLVFRPVLAGSPARSAWRVAYAGLHTLVNGACRLASPAFWRGYGYVREPMLHGGLRLYAETPQHAASELSAAGFEVLRVLPADHPHTRPRVTNPWNYLACRKTARA